jgi:hypothetical protein
MSHKNVNEYRASLSSVGCLGRQVEPDRVRQPLRDEPVQELGRGTGTAPLARINALRSGRLRLRCPGSCTSADLTTLTWSATVSEPASSLRSRQVSGSPVPAAPCSTEHSRLRTHPRDVGQRLTIEDQRDREIGDHVARIGDRRRLAPPSQRRRSVDHRAVTHEIAGLGG